MANFWAPISYGYTPIYWLTVSGIPVVFTERALGLGVPSGWAGEDASLVIDDAADIGCSQIDRDRGVGMGLDFQFKLLDTEAVRSWLRRYTRQATLTVDLLASDTTATVDDTTGWPSTGAFYCSLERILYTGKTGTTFTGLLRGATGTLPLDHRTGTVGQVVTDLARFWRGRDVTLWCTLMDPTGHICGSDLMGQESRQVWRGRISQAAVRAPDGFTFQATSLDRVLDQKLSAKLTGDVISDDLARLVPTGWGFTLIFKGYDASGAGAAVWSATVTCNPFSGMAGIYMTAAQMQTRISTAWSDAVTAAGVGAYLDDLSWYGFPGSQLGEYSQVKVKKDATTYFLLWWLVIDGKEQDGAPAVPPFPTGMTGAIFVHLSDWNGASLLLPQPVLGGIYGGITLPPGDDGLTVRLSEGDPNLIPPTGRVRVKSGDLVCTYAYAAVGVALNGCVELHQCVPLDKQTPIPNWSSSADQLVGATCEILLGDSGTWLDMSLRCLESSGTGLRGDHDTLPLGAGYGLSSDDIAVDSFNAKLGSGGVSQLVGATTMAGSSFIDVLGGALALYRKAVVCRPPVAPDPDPNYTMRLTVVDTGVSADYLTTITDADLLSHGGDPLVSAQLAATPNVITINRSPDGQDVTDHVILSDLVTVEAVGKIDIAYRIDALDRGQLTGQAVQSVVAAHFANDQTLAAVQLRCHPSVLAEVGDAIWLTTTHPGVWTWTTDPGQPGYDGPGRVVGRTMNLKSLAVTLSVLIDGSLKVRALSPAMLVGGFDSSSAPTYIDVPWQYQATIDAAILAANGPVPLIHYKPGQSEDGTVTCTISATDPAAPPPGFVRLLVTSGSRSGTWALVLPTATDMSYLTLPPTAAASTYQKNFAHTLDGSQWG